MGIVINMPLNIHLGDILRNMQIESANDAVSKVPILAGGPLQQERGFVLHRTTNKKWESSLALTNSISITTSRDILLAIADANANGPKDMIIALGYSGWDAGQLERELAENAWLCGPADPQVLFDIPPDHRWRAAGALLGIDMDCVSHEVGHA